MSLIVAAIVTLLVLFAIALIVGQIRLRNHRGSSREEFINAFSDMEIPGEIPGAVYDFYKRGVVFKDFAVAPSDTYEDALNKCEEDVSDDAQFLAKKLGLKLPTSEVQQQWTQHILPSRINSQSLPPFSTDSTRLLQPIRTVREMVLWLNWIRQHQETKAGV